MGCISFNGNKIITTGGGGIVITNNKRLAKKIRHLTTTAKIPHKWEYIHDEIGFNFRMPNINAALGIAQLEKIKVFLKAKRKILSIYSKVFEKIDGVELYKEPKFSKSNYWLQTLVLNKKNSKIKNIILKKLYQNKIYARPVWKLISELKPYKNCESRSFRSEDIYKRTINLQIGQGLVLK